MASKYHVLTTALAGSLLASGPALAQDSQQDLQKQINALQAQLQAIQKQLAAQQAATRQVQAEVRTVPGASVASVPPGSQVVTVAPDGGVRVGAITVKMGGFIEAAGIFRSRNETSDVGSSFGSGLPFQDVPSSHLTEFRGSARQSRLSLLMQGQWNEYTNVAAYFEGDFLGSGVSSKNDESNSYVPRLRQAYATVDNASGWHFEAGQAWSLATQFKDGLVPRDENIPLTIDAQYVPGFNWRRDPQVRLTKTFSPAFSMAFSLEGPAVDSFGGGGNTGLTELVTTVPGLSSSGGTLNSGACNNVVVSPGANGLSFPGSQGTTTVNCFSYDIPVAPDMVLKAALDPGWGHYELFGLGRFFQTRSAFQEPPLPTAGKNITGQTEPENNIAFGGGGGFSVILPVVPKWLDIQANGLGGWGIGNYGSAQISDVTTNQFGQPVPIPMLQGMAGAVAHPAPNWDVYFYGGIEKAFDEVFEDQHGNFFGYGVPTVNNTGCNIENTVNTGSSPPNLCNGVTGLVWQLTGGFWDKMYNGPAGTVQWGLQYSYTERELLQGIGGSPHADENMVFLSFRYYPFTGHLPAPSEPLKLGPEM
jgi:hypothetical protein